MCLVGGLDLDIRLGYSTWIFGLDIRFGCLVSCLNPTACIPIRIPVCAMGAGQHLQSLANVPLSFLFACVAFNRRVGRSGFMMRANAGVTTGHDEAPLLQKGVHARFRGASFLAHIGKPDMRQRPCCLCGAGDAGLPLSFATRAKGAERREAQPSRCCALSCPSQPGLRRLRMTENAAPLGAPPACRSRGPA